ncbi:hypothetical protein [Ramlibacter montanisoli]|uniref:Uncharacterized protein n=1 Tax=Ramlibacter montanisoli TaxID=2732512 RepID=A0A849KD11_9BURK|nr:hypothetical protein [Ramlibacter montanisoli]NNU45260.1 hypothetical protein [Ramlibacter montanisoli]
MKRLFLALTLLLMSFLAALDHLDAFHALVARIGIQRWMTELVLAAAAVALFVNATHLHRRLLFPRRGLRLLAAGLGVYAIALVAATGWLSRAVDFFVIDTSGAWSAVADVVADLGAQPVFLTAQVLLVVGAVRALSNLVPPAEFEADY